MTNKQTIDGVSRELLETFAAYVADSPNAIMRARATELRALLDKPDTPYTPKGEWSFEYIGGGDIVIKSGKDWTLIKRGDGPIYEQFLYRFCEEQLKADAQPQGEVELLRGVVNEWKTKWQHEAGQTGLLRAQLAEQDALLREFAASSYEAAQLAEQIERAEPLRLSTTLLAPSRPFKLSDAKGKAGVLRARLVDMADNLSTSAEPKPRGEPVARLEVSADRNAALTVTNEDWLRMLKSQGVHQVVQLYAGQPAPLADEAAKAFAKGFNTLEAGGGKYRINMQFQSREDAWGAFNVLARLKQLNTPQ